MNDCKIETLNNVIVDDRLDTYGVVELGTEVALTKAQFQIVGNALLGHEGEVHYYSDSAPDTEISESTIKSSNTLTRYRVTMPTNAKLYFNKYFECINTFELPFKFISKPNKFVAFTKLITFTNLKNLENLEYIKGLSTTPKLLGFNDQSSGLHYIGSLKQIAEFFPELGRLDIPNVAASVIDGTLKDLAGMEHLYYFRDGKGAARQVNVWTANLRPSTYPIISLDKVGTTKLWFNESSAKNFIINMSNCQASASDTFKKIYMNGLNTSDSDVQAAISTLESKGYSVNPT